MIGNLIGFVDVVEFDYWVNFVGVVMLLWLEYGFGGKYGWLVKLSILFCFFMYY